MSQPNKNTNNNDHEHKYMKIFVGNLAWRITTYDLRRYFERFGEVVDANVVIDTSEGKNKSKGYGFVIFREAKSAARACESPWPIIDGRQTNVNMAFFGLKNKINHFYQNGYHQAGPSQQYQPNLGYINPHVPQVYWNPYYGQHCYMYNGPYYPYQTPTVSTYSSIFSIMYRYNVNNDVFRHRMNIPQRVRISKPPQRPTDQTEKINDTEQEIVKEDVVDNTKLDNESNAPQENSNCQAEEKDEHE
ncbi:unnamed protein product [Cochlearia groenlandica]